jgi:hypothetical protein
MRKGVVFAVVGLPGFQDALDRATKEIRAQVSALMEETANDIRDTARAHVSVEDGDLRDQIIVIGKGLNWGIGISEAVIARRGGDRIHQRPFIYGAILERGSRPGEAARPFMRPAADSHLARFQSRLASIGIVI